MLVNVVLFTCVKLRRTDFITLDSRTHTHTHTHTLSLSNIGPDDPKGEKSGERKRYVP